MLGTVAETEQLGWPDEPRLRNTIEWSDSLLAHLRELLHHRELLWLVTQREIKVRYKQTLLGVLWAVVQPLSLMLVFTLFFSLLAGLPTDGPPYPLFSYVALLPWTFFATALSFAVPSLIANSHIITRIYFPREIIPLASVLVALVDFAVASCVLFGLLAIYRVPPSWSLLYLPVLLAVQLTFTVGLSLLLSAFTVLYRDVRFTLPLLLQLWMFLTPILYPVSIVPESLRTLYLICNPLAALVEGYRRALLHGQPPDLVSIGCAALLSLLLLWLGYRYFKRLERRFADIV
jgi:lipopolysaccharide transport system permease protein